MPPKKRRKKEYSAEEWKVQRGRRYRKKAANEPGTGDQDASQQGATEDLKRTSYMEVERENALFEKYYQGQGFIPEEEWAEFLSALRENLPVTFRITGTRNLATHVLSCLQSKFFVDLEGLEVEGEKLPAPKPLPWYPGNLAWSVPLSKKFIRKSPLVSKFHAFLVQENSQGNISRQEAVSMIPPLLLDVKPAHKVLDMCAAPGSKTAQLIELLHSEDTPTSPMPSGIVLANDANNKRCYMLVHQAKRLNSPCLMVANHDASVFPMLYYHDEADVRHPLYYDRVLCDVPCGGDGTLRKNVSIWKSWNPLLGPSLHKLQLRILNRGLELLAPGGRLVYSTCSLNPIENEAVISTALSLCKGSVELVDCKTSLKGLKTMAGLSNWKAMSKEGEWLEYGYSSVPKSLSRHFTPTMFPPDKALGLEKCIRVLPHYQDTGGFFIAVLEKTDWLPWQAKKKTKTASQPGTADTQLTGKPDLNRTTESNFEPTPDSMAETTQEGGVVDGGVANVPLLEGVDGGVVGGGVANVSSQERSVVEGDVTEPPSQDQRLERSVADAPPSSKQEERPSVKILGRPDFQSSTKRGFKEDPYIFFDRDTDFFDTIKPYYGLPEGFPLDQLLTRTRTGKKKNLYLSSRLVKELTIRNEHVLKIINIGVKVMSRCAHPLTPCSFRLCQEGVDSLLPYISNHCVGVRQEDLSVLLKEANPLITSLTPHTQEGLQTLGIGPVVFVYMPDSTDAESAASTRHGVPEDAVGSSPGGPAEGEVSKRGDRLEIPITCPIYLSGWLAAKSARLFLDKNYRYHFLSMLGHDPPTNQCLETIRTTRSGRGHEEDGEGCGKEDMEVEGDGNEDGERRGKDGEGCGSEGELQGNEDGEGRGKDGEGCGNVNMVGGEGCGSEGPGNSMGGGNSKDPSVGVVTSDRTEEETNSSIDT